MLPRVADWRLARSGAACEARGRALRVGLGSPRLSLRYMHGKRGEQRVSAGVADGRTGNGRPMHRSGSHPARGQTIMAATATLPRARSAILSTPLLEMMHADQDDLVLGHGSTWRVSV
jgi:hypothetical protein